MVCVIVALRRRQPVERGGLLVALVVVPLALGFAGQYLVAFVYPRFFLYILPAFFLLASIGLEGLGSKGWPLALAIFVGWAASLPQALAPFAPPEDDLRPIVRMIDQWAQPGDGIIVGYIWQEGMLRAYLPDLPVNYYLGWFDQDEVAISLSSLFERHQRLWLLTYKVALQHPANPAGWWLEQHAARGLFYEQGRLRLTLYLRPSQVVSTEPQVAFAGGIRLCGASVPVEVHAGDIVPVTLCWTVDEPVAESFMVFVHLWDGNKIWAQSDGPPVNGLRPFPSLAAGERVRDRRALAIPPQAPPGSYSLLLGLYQGDSGERLQVVEGEFLGSDHLQLGRVRIISREDY